MFNVCDFFLFFFIVVFFVMVGVLYVRENVTDEFHLLSYVLLFVNSVFKKINNLLILCCQQ